MPTASELVAHDKTIEEVEKIIGADKLIYQDLDDLIEAVKEGNADIEQFDTSVFTGEYITGDVDQAYLDRLEQERNDEAKSSSGALEDVDMVMDIHNEGNV